MSNTRNILEKKFNVYMIESQQIIVNYILEQIDSILKLELHNRLEKDFARHIRDRVDKRVEEYVSQELDKTIERLYLSMRKEIDSNLEKKMSQEIKKYFKTAKSSISKVKK